MDPSSYREAWLDAWQQDARDAAARAARARTALPELVAILVDRGARRVVLIGSLAGGRFGHRSDIDLVVEGIGGMSLWEAQAALDRACPEFEVDLVPFEDARPFVRALVARGECEVLHDATATT